MRAQRCRALFDLRSRMRLVCMAHPGRDGRQCGRAHSPLWSIILFISCMKCARSLRDRHSVDLAQRDNVVTTPELAAAFTDHVCDLLALALGPTRDAAEQARTRGLSAARLQAIKDDIADNLGRPDLSVHSVAARHNVSVRYVQKLFEESGCTFTQFVMEQRLTAAHKALAARSDVRILSIVYDLGFNDVSHFNRSFRQRFGCTPSDVRNSARAWR